MGHFDAEKYLMRLLSRPRNEWVDNTKMVLRDAVAVALMYPIQDRAH
jgi:hypothetical protein